MRVLHLISSAGWYGAENAVVNLAEASRSLGCDVTIGVLRDARNPHTEIADEARRRGVPAQIFPCSGRLDVSTILELRRWLSRSRIEVLHTHGYKANFYAQGAILLRKIRVVTTIHTGTEQPVTTGWLRFYEGLERLFLRRADRVIAVSTGIADSLRARGVANSRLVTIFNGVDPARFQLPRRRLPGIRDGVKVVGTVCRLIREKGPYELLQAAGALIERIPDVLFVFVGDGPERAELEHTASQWGLAQHVLFMGVRDDMPEVYASFDAFALPSFSEGMPMTVLEAMAAGLPVIATRVGAIPQLLEPDCGLLFESGDAPALASGLARIFTDQPFAAQMASAAKSRLTDRYSARAMAKQHLDLYAERAGEE